MTASEAPELDFSDLEKKFAVTLKTTFEAVIVVSHLPIVDEAKESKLVAVLKKIFKNMGSIVKEGGICMPKDPSAGLSKGFCFIEFENESMAQTAVKMGDQYRLDKSHVLRINFFDDIEKYANMDESFKEPAMEEFVEKEHLKSWLSDDKARDQFALLKGDSVSIYYNNKAEKPDLVHSRNNWTDTIVRFSPLGLYLATFHKQGIALWGGKSWNKIVRFPHHHVKLIEFSPNENYLVTWSQETFKSLEGQDHNLCVWDIASGTLLRSFFVEKDAQEKMEWPFFKWSFDDKYIARCISGPEGMIQVYELPSMGLLDKKSIKVEDLQDFVWSPKDHFLSFWTVEKGNIPARVTIMSVPKREIIRTKNLFGVLRCDMFWQSKGDFLLVKVDKIKTKKQVATNFELFRLREKDIPVDVVEVQGSHQVSTLSWEPEGQRFVVLSNEGQKIWSHFYQVMDIKPNVANPVNLKCQKLVETKGVNTISWSPKGRFCVLAGVKPFQGSLYFWDTEELSLSASEDHYSCTEVSWDPTGRYFVSSVSGWHVQTDCGFMMWSMTGSQVTRQMIPGFKQFVWRPRPPTLLSLDQIKKIKKNLKEYSKEFDEEDAAESSKASLEVIQKRKTQWKEWRTLMKKWETAYKEQSKERIQLYGFDPDKEVVESDDWVQIE